jgi:hypothetical protein
MGRVCSTHVEKRTAYRNLLGKPEGKRRLGRPRRQDNIKMDLIEIEWGGMDWIDLPHDRDQWRALVNTVMNLRSFIHQWLYSPLSGLGLFCSSVIFFTQSVGLLGLGITPSQGRYLHTGQHKQNKCIHRHSCLEWDSNPRSQLSSERRQFMP